MHALLFDFIFEVDVLICNFVFDVIFVLIRDIVSHLIRYIKYFSNIHNYFCVFKHTYFFLFILKFPLHMWNNMSVCLCVFCVWLAKEKSTPWWTLKIYYIILYYIILYYIIYVLICKFLFDLIFFVLPCLIWFIFFDAWFCFWHVKHIGYDVLFCVWTIFDLIYNLTRDFVFDLIHVLRCDFIFDLMNVLIRDFIFDFIYLLICDSLFDWVYLFWCVILYLIWCTRIYIWMVLDLMYYDLICEWNWIWCVENPPDRSSPVVLLSTAVKLRGGVMTG